MKVGWFNRSSLKSEARRILEKSARFPFCESPLKLQRHLVQEVALRNGILTANSAHSYVCGLYVPHTAVSDSTMKKFRIDSQWRDELILICHLSFLNRKSLYVCSAILGTARWCLFTVATTFYLSLRCEIFIAVIPVGFQIVNQETRRLSKLWMALTGWGAGEISWKSPRLSL
jgi:hypothetical protein